MDAPLFWSDEYCSINQQSKYSAKHDLEGESYLFEFIYTANPLKIKSPGRATFGGIWVGNNIATSELYCELYSSIFKQLGTQREIEITFPPDYFFHSMFAPQHLALIRLGFKNSYSDVNFHIELDEWSYHFMSKGNRKKNRQFENLGGDIMIANENDYLAAYDVLKKNREARGVKLTMDRDKFIQNLVNLPTKYKLYLAKIANEIAAVAYVVRISEQVDYVLFWGDSQEFRHLSPVASMLKFLVAESKHLGCKTLDLGISSVDGDLDIGLARFKKNLGGIETFKRTFRHYE
jgi:hypothetical protein